MQVQLLQLSLKIKKTYGASLLCVLSLGISTDVVLTFVIKYLDQVLGC